MVARIIPNGGDERQDGSQQSEEEKFLKIKDLFETEGQKAASGFIFDDWFKWNVLPGKPKGIPDSAAAALEEAMKEAWAAHRRIVVAYITQVAGETENKLIAQILMDLMMLMP